MSCELFGPSRDKGYGNLKQQIKNKQIPMCASTYIDEICKNLYSLNVMYD